MGDSSFQVRLGPPIDRSSEVRPGEPVTVGGGPAARIQHAGLDALHCRLEVTSRGLEIFNMSKATGTFVNGRKVERSLLKDGDELRLGPVALKVAVGSMLARAPGGAGPIVAVVGPPSAMTPPKIVLAPPPSPPPPAPAAAAAPGASDNAPPLFGAPPKQKTIVPQGVRDPVTLKAEKEKSGSITLNPGAFSPAAPPPLTRRYDRPAGPIAGGPGAPPVPQAPAAASASGSLIYGESSKPFRMSAAEESTSRPVFRERDGSALLAAPNPTISGELSRKSFFAPRAEERTFEPAPAFEPSTGLDAGAARLDGSRAADPSLKSETPAERAIRSELEASGLDVLARLGGHDNVTVYRARRRDLGQEVVVRAVHAEPGDPSGRAGRLIAEAKIAARLHHPGIVQVHGVFKGRSYVAIVLEYLRGVSLASEVAKRGHLTPRESVVLAERVGRALAHAHEMGVVHRDVSPRNIMLTSDGETKLLGFGFAVSLEGGGRAVVPAAEATGTPGFAAPEQVAAAGGADAVGSATMRDVDRRADVYGLGATLHFSLAGASPNAPGSVAGLPKEVPEPVVRIVERATRPRPADRFDGVPAMLAALHDAGTFIGQSTRIRKTGAGIATKPAAEAAIADEGPAAEPEPSGFRGRLPGREILALLRDLEPLKKTGWLEVRGLTLDGADIVGAVHFRDGHFVRSGVRGRTTAVDALAEVAALPSAEFAVVYAPLDALADEERRAAGAVLAEVEAKLKAESL